MRKRRHECASSALDCPFLARHIAAYEEAQARTDEVGKNAGPFRLGELFEDPSHSPGESDSEQATHIREIAKRLLNDAASLYAISNRQPDVRISGTEGRFSSLISNGTANDVARFFYFPATHAWGKHAVVIVHHWNADPKQYNAFGRIFSLLGVSAAVLTLPYHGLRGDGTAVANRFLNADVSNSARSVRQGVLDVQVLVEWLKGLGAGKVGVLGVSLGSCVASLAAAFNPQVRAAALLLTAGDFASVVWAGRATRHIQKAMDGHIDLKDLQQLWSIIAPSPFVDRFGASEVKLLIVSGAYDQVVLPKLAFEFVDQLKRAHVDVKHLCWPCGHYSLGILPFSMMGLVRSFIFLKKTLSSIQS